MNEDGNEGVAGDEGAGIFVWVWELVDRRK